MTAHHGQDSESHDDLLGCDPIPFPADNRAVALDLAQRGLAIFPIRDWGDGDEWKPIAAFPSKATSDPDRVSRWWRKWPDARVGLLAGRRNGITVLDIDIKNGKDGQATLADLGFPDIASLSPCRVKTPSGGWHLIFDYAPELKNSVGKIGAGLDLKTDGGFIVAPGSFKAGACYVPEGEALSRDSVLPALPAALRRLAPAHGNDDFADLLGGSVVPIVIASCYQKEWAERRLVELAEEVSSAPEGQRHDTLNAHALLCGGYGAHGALTEAQAKAQLIPAALSCGLSEREAEKTFQHAWADGLKKPAELPPDCEDEFEEESDTGKPPAVVSDETNGWHIDAFSVTQEPDLSQDQLALDLGKSGMDKNGRYVAEMGGWILWDERAGRWQVAGSMQHMRIVRDFIRAKSKLLIEWAEDKAADMKPKDAEQFLRAAKGQAKAMKQDAAIAAVERLARSNKASLSNAETWDADDFRLGTPGGTVDLRTGAMRPAKRSDLITKQTSVAPDPEGARPHAWLNFLSEVFPGDPDMVTFIQRLLGYSLTGSTEEHKFFMFNGTGRNGKGTLLNTFQKIIGDYARGIPTTTLLESRNPQHKESLARLRGARFVRGAEIPKGQVWNESLVKTLTGGDVITANLMRQNSFDFLPKFTLVVDGNTKPRIRTTDPAMNARMTLVPFGASFRGREDRSLPDRLQAEAGAILRWCIDGAVAWRKDGLRIPETVREASREYLDAEDRLSGFITEILTRDSAGTVPTKRLYILYCQWCEEERERPMTKRSFIDGMVERGFQKKKGTGNVDQFIGLSLKNHDDLGAEP